MDIITLEGQVSLEKGYCQNEYCERRPEIFIGDQSISDILDRHPGGWVHVQIVVGGRTVFTTITTGKGQEREKV